MFLSRSFRSSSAFALTLIIFTTPLLAQSPKSVAHIRTPGAQRIAFEEARRMLAGEREGNLNERPGAYTRTRLRDGRVLELFYPITAQTRSSRSKRSTSVPGYGLLYDSEAAYEEAYRPRHILEELLPHGESFVGEIPQLIARLEQRLRVGARKLDYTRASLKRIDVYLSSYRRTHTTADTDPALFQELTAYYGEVARREVGGEWRVRSESIAQKRYQAVPNVSFDAGGGRRDLRPWSSILNLLYNEDQRGLTLTATFDADMRAIGR